MTPVFEHIEQTKYLLRQLLESGFLSGQGIDSELKQCEKTAKEFGLTTGSKLISRLSDILTAVRAGQNTFNNAALAYSNLISYYNLIANMLVMETITSNIEREHEHGITTATH